MTDEDARLHLEIVVGPSGCTELGEIEVAESDEQVVIETTSVVVPADNCPMDSAHEVATIELDSAVGGRGLVGCDPFNFDSDCRAVNRQRLDPTNFGDTTKFGEPDDPDFPPDNDG